MKTKPANRSTSTLRRYHRSLVFELVRTRGPISRADLAREGHLSMPAVMEIVSGLIDEGVVEEAGVGPSSGGRRPVLLQLVSEAYCAVGIEVGTEALTIVVTDMHAAIKRRVQIASQMRHGPQALLHQLRCVFDAVFAEYTPGYGTVLGIGLALPAPMDASISLSFSPPSYPGWGELHLHELIATETRAPVLIDNDANAAALGELLFGAGRGVQNLFYVLLHRGIGGAVIVNGDLYRGALGAAGELGHLLIDRNGPACGCGQTGCLEAYVGHTAIVDRAVHYLSQAHQDRLHGQPSDQITAEDVIDAGLDGDPVALQVMRETGTYLGIGVLNAVQLLNPERVVIGGGSVRAGAALLEPVGAVVHARAIGCLRDRVSIVAGELGEDASAIGAAALVIRTLLIDSHHVVA